MRTFLSDFNSVLALGWGTATGYFSVYLSAFRLLISEGDFDFEQPRQDYKRSFALFSQAMLLLLAFGDFAFSQPATPLQDQAEWQKTTAELSNLSLVLIWTSVAVCFGVFSSLVSCAYNARYISILGPISVVLRFSSVFIVFLLSILLVGSFANSLFDVLNIIRLFQIPILGYSISTLWNVVLGVVILLTWSNLLFSFCIAYAKSLCMNWFIAMFAGVFSLIATLLVSNFLIFIVERTLMLLQT